MCMEEASLKPNREWSVKQVFNPMVRACSSASWHSTLNAWCPCTISICSLIQMLRSSGALANSVGSTTLPLLNTSGMHSSGA